ncbi:Oxidase, partial [Lachnellula willkommii]
SSTASANSTNEKVRSVRYTFEYNRTFAEASDSADRAWKDLFPLQNGYFTYPEIAPERSTLSVYHQLHCLNGIREGYWTVHDLAVAGKKLNDNTLPMMISPPHIRHCIDLLRQSLMCNADTTVEKKDEVAGGVHGFGVQHRCKHWFQLVDWTKKAQGS